MRCGAGIVLYNPNIERLKQNIDAVTNQVELVVLVDNGSQNSGEIINLYKQYENIRIVMNKSNLGIAKALNQIFELADELEYEWIITLDQDTVLENNTIIKMIDHCNENKIGIICPRVNYEGWTNRELRKDGCEDINACMTSGAFTKVESWRMVGGFEESYFIDYVDNEFCMKLRKQGFRIVRDYSCSMNHQLGESKELSLFGKKVHYSKHSPFRCYYMTRNNLVFIRTYREDINVSKEYLKFGFLLMMNLFFNYGFIQTKKMIWQGIKDYRQGIMGKLNNPENSRI